MSEAFSDNKRSLAYRYHVVNLSWLAHTILNFEHLKIWRSIVESLLNFTSGLFLITFGLISANQSLSVALPLAFYYRFTSTSGLSKTSGLSQIVIAKRFMVWRNLNVRSQINQNPRTTFWLADFLYQLNKSRALFKQPRDNFLTNWQPETAKICFQIVKMSNYIILKRN